jgi:enhancing lycopene biosynthesis protein 2
MKNKKFAVVLAGCGVYDGAEIHEAVLTLLAIDKAGSTYECFAPDVNQYHVVDHLNGKATKETRNVLTEAARIARGNIKKLSQLEINQFDALVFPGGFGVAKNLSTFAVDGEDCLVNPDIEKLIVAAHQAKLPIGAMCIAPVVLAKVLGTGTLTIGNDAETASTLENMGATHLSTNGDEIVVDNENKIVTTPCYMLNSPISVVAKGTKKLIKALLQFMK